MQQPLRVPPSAPARLVVLASGTGSLLASLLEAAVGDYPARVVAVGADRDCPALDIAADASVATFTVPLSATTPTAPPGTRRSPRRPRRTARTWWCRPAS